MRPRHLNNSDIRYDRPIRCMKPEPGKCREKPVLEQLRPRPPLPKLPEIDHSLTLDEVLDILRKE